MTAWLSGWLRDIVLIILLATFVDLLIPNNSLQRYVKVVVSLIILLTILSPVISFLKEERAVNQALEQASGKKDGSQALNLILSNGAKLKSENDRSSTLLAEQQVGKMMKESLESSLPLEVQEVLVTIMEEEGVSPSIEHIQVVLRAENNSELDNETPSTEQAVRIDNVSPVSVKIRIDDTEQETGLAKLDQRERSPSQLKLEDHVMHQLVEQWGLAENRIQVEWR
ncbi:MAG: stage III sporulation protein AF [Paenibacillaceae bacterium]